MKTLILKKLSKKYFPSKSYVVKDVDIQIEKGEIIALVGESGSGKTTILRMIAGFETPSYGEVIINSRPVYHRYMIVNPEKRGVSMVFQDYALFPHLNVKENIGFGLYKMSKPERKEIIQEMLDLTELRGFEKQYPHELSGGQMQRVALARGLAPRPSLLLLDEPFNNLDLLLKNQIMEEVRLIIKKTDTTTLFVTHDWKEAFSIADRIAVLKEGKILKVDTPENTYNNPKNEYVGKFFGKVNILKARILKGGFDTVVGFIECDNHALPGKEVSLLIRPEGFLLAEDKKGICGEVKRVLFFGQYQEVLLSVKNKNTNPCELTVNFDTDYKIREKDVIYVVPKRDRIVIIEDKRNEFLQWPAYAQ